MKISIITPSFNQGGFIERTIQSVISQNNSSYELEHIIIDGNSTDQTLSILNKYQTHIMMRVEPDRGQTHAINKGLQIASGDIIGWLNADDIYYSSTLEKINKLFTEQEDCDVIYGDARLIDADDKTIGLYSTEPFNLKRLHVRCFLSQPATFFRRSAVLKYGKLDEQLNFCMDYEFWLRMGMQGAKFSYLPDIFAGARIHPKTKSSLFSLKACDEAINMVHKKLGYIPPQWLVSHACAKVKHTSGLNYPHYLFILFVWANLWNIVGHYQSGWSRISTWFLTQAIMLREFVTREIITIKKRYRH